MRGVRLSGGPAYPAGPCAKSSKNGGLILDPHLSIFGVPKNTKKSIRAEFLGFWREPKNGTPSRAPKSEILPLFTTLELGPTPQKGTPFWSHFGDLFSQKHEKKGFQKSPQNHSQKTLKMGPKQGVGGGLFYTFGLFLSFFWALNPARTHFAAGTLLDVHFSLFWRHCSRISV